ncbi:hypothetical protein MMC13_005681 [Lambiella insularis]|nr:hypothetical protein [Lambiella insularis]
MAPYKYIINIYDKGSTYLLLDSDDTTPLYHVSFNHNHAPHMTVTRAADPRAQAGTATFIPTKKFGFSTSSRIEMTLHSHTMPFNKEKSGPFSSDKRYFQSPALGRVYWKSGYTGSGFLEFVGEDGKQIAVFKNTMVDGRRLGVFEIMVEPLGEEVRDEIVVSGLTMLQEDKTSMSSLASSLHAAGGG